MQTNTTHLFPKTTTAPLVGAGEPVLVLIGIIMRDITVEESPIYVLISENTTRKYDPDFFPLFEFLSIPRRQHEALEWLERTSAPEGVLEALTAAGVLIRVDTDNPLSAAESFTGIKIITQPGTDLHTYIQELIRTDQQNKFSTILDTTTKFNWLKSESNETFDIPSIIAEASHSENSDLIQTASQILSKISESLKDNQLSFRWLNLKNQGEHN